MRKRLLLSGLLVVACTSAHAVFAVTLDQPLQSIALPIAPTDLIFNGTVTKDELGSGQWTLTIRFAGLPSDTDYLNTLVSGDITSWLATPDPVFTGELFRITVLPTNQIGLHDFNSDSPTTNPFYRLQYTGVTGNQYDSGFVPYAVDIVPVPEPATMCVLALGGLAMLRRRKRA
jgi:hypothetical protein